LLRFSPACKIMDLIVLDLEWTQSPNNKKNPIVPFEIIEIGAIKLDTSFVQQGHFCEVIKPSIYKRLHSISRDITHLTMKQLNKGKSFKDVFTRFLEWCGDDFIICTWGCTDITELQRNMKYHGFSLFPAPVIYYDIQKIFSLVYEENKKLRRSLQDAVNILNIETTIPFHRALSDACYTAEVIKHMKLSDLTENYSVDYYQKPQSKKEEYYFNYKDYTKYVSREFDNKTDLLSDRNVASTVCRKCGKACRKKIRWFTGNSKTYYALANCAEHGLFRSKLRIKKSDTGYYFAVKTTKYVGPEALLDLKQKQLEIRKKRRLKRKKEEEN